MTHVVTEACIKCKYTDCVDVCPVDCFREGPNFLVIDPDECIDCAVCIPECPVNAIVPEEDLQLVCVDWQPLGELWQKGSRASNPGGNALGFDPETKGTYMAWAEVVEWKGSQYDEQVHAWVK